VELTTYATVLTLLYLLYVAAVAHLRCTTAADKAVSEGGECVMIMPMAWLLRLLLPNSLV
jgi:hypothetical protein